MKKFILSFIMNAVGLFLVALVIPGIAVKSWGVLLAAALVLGILNAVLKPLIILVTLPINIISLGLFTFFINGFMFYLVSKIVRGFNVADFWSAFWGALFFSVINIIFNAFFGAPVNVKFGFGGRRHSTGNVSKHRDAIDVDVVGDERKEEGKSLK